MDKKKKIILVTVIAILVLLVVAGIICYVVSNNNNSNAQGQSNNSNILSLYNELQQKSGYSVSLSKDENNKMYFCLLYTSDAADEL